MDQKKWKKQGPDCPRKNIYKISSWWWNPQAVCRPYWKPKESLPGNSIKRKKRREHSPLVSQNLNERNHMNHILKTNMVPFFRVILIFSLPFGASRKSSNLSKRMKISHTWPSHSLHAKWRNPWIFRPPCVFFWQPWDNLKCLLPDFVQVMLVFRQGTNDRLTETFGQVVGAKIYLETFLLPVLGASVDINQWIPENSAVFGSALRRPHAVFFKAKIPRGDGVRVVREFLETCLRAKAGEISWKPILGWSWKPTVLPQRGLKRTVL